MSISANHYHYYSTYCSNDKCSFCNENVVRSRYLLHNPLLRPKPGVANASSPHGSEGSLVTLLAPIHCLIVCLFILPLVLQSSYKEPLCLGAGG